MAGDVFLLEELRRFVDAEARDGEAVLDDRALGLEAFDGGEERETGGDVVFDDEDALPFTEVPSTRLWSP